MSEMICAELVKTSQKTEKRLISNLDFSSHSMQAYN